jgi:RNA recognition motif-containing protein
VLSSKPVPVEEPEPSPSENRKLFIGGLDFRLKEAHLIKILQRCGKLTFFEYLYHRHGPDCGKPCGFCFVEFETKEESERAIKALHGKLAAGRKLRVYWATDKFDPDAPPAATAEDDDAKEADEDVRTQVEINALEMKLKFMQEGHEPVPVNIPMVTRATMAEEAALKAKQARFAPYQRGGRGGNRGGGRGGGRGRR